MIDLVVSDAADEALQSICATKKLAVRTLETRCNERSTTQSETDAVRVGVFPYPSLWKFTKHRDQVRLVDL